MKDIYFIESLEQLRVLSDPLRIRILWALDEWSKTGKILADEFNLPPAKVRYHLKELEKAELVQVEKTEEKNGIMQKFYRPVARAISLEKIAPQLNGKSDDLSDSMRENALAMLERTKTMIHKSGVYPNTQIFEDLWLTPTDQKRLADHIRKLHTMMQEMRKKEVADDVAPFHISIIGFPLNKGE